MIDNKKLMDAIDSLDNDENYVEIKNSEPVKTAACDRKKKDVIEENKTPDKANLILLIIFFVLIITAVIYYASPMFKDEELFASIDSYGDGESYKVGENGVISVDAPDSTNIVDPKDYEKVVDNIIIEKEFIDYEKELNFLVKNANNLDVKDISVEIVFYDGEGKIIEIDCGDITFLPAGMSRYIYFYDTPEKYERYDVLIQVDKETQDYYASCMQDVSYECLLNSEEDELIIRGKNNSQDTIDTVVFEIIYYDEKDNVIAVEELYEFDIRRNKTFEIEEYISLYDSESYDEIPYSRYEIRLVEAYISNY